MKKLFFSLTTLIIAGLFFTGCSVKNINNSKSDIKKNYNKVFYYTKLNDKILIKSILKIKNNIGIVETKNTSNYLSIYDAKNNALIINNLYLMNNEVRECYFKNGILTDYKNYFLGYNQPNEKDIYFDSEYTGNKKDYSYCSDLISLFAKKI